MRDYNALTTQVRRRIRTCEEACAALVVVSETCAEACLALDGDGDITTCFLADLDCVEIGTVTATVLSWTSQGHQSSAVAVLDACVRSCAVSTAACERMAQLYSPWITCTAACERLRLACSELLLVLRIPSET